MEPMPDPELPALAPKRELRVLIVEDNVEAAASLQKLLERCGYSVRVATTATQALEIAKRTRPDVALVDIGLPDYDGHVLARALREDPATASIRLIAVTASPDRSRSAKAGFKLHLVKPIDPETLLLELAARS